ncbi:LysR substrate-binding domain-containing protein [Iodobacter sp. LRB]|uniref:LysR family transcriptional regulator n=1 Tax=unclassified Iodobacter TaxID=235634 RepID=UPI000C10C98A|nr:LysR substrate-binding domain-containing protein [Iodobacter sp. BJB302]PHV00963.1 LysR family transcriptional regulator [Iodobacter sp. BJB302]
MTNDLDTALLRSFVGVVRSGSINRAAILQGKTQPALSQQIQRLEQQLGQTLLLRSPKGIRLSPEGEALLPYAERILSLTDQLSLKPVLQGEQQRSIGLVEDFVSGHLNRVLADFACAHPRLRLRVDVADKQTLFAAFERKELDVLVSMPLAAAATPDQALSLPLNWFAAPGFNLQVASIPLVIFSQPCTWRDRILETLNRANQPWHIVFESSSLAALQAAAEAGLGVTALLADTPPQHSQLITELPPLPDVTIAVYRQQGDTDPINQQLAGLFLRELQRS